MQVDLVLLSHGGVNRTLPLLPRSDVEHARLCGLAGATAAQRPLRGA
ncbi:MAG: hypothetical protein M3R63_12720 [Actinomycetota bacterium]|nr:hypothetical protein [Actinomycetota bacterium]